MFKFVQSTASVCDKVPEQNLLLIALSVKWTGMINKIKDLNTAVPPYPQGIPETTKNWNDKIKENR